jgi:hypothetical protein
MPLDCARFFSCPHMNLIKQTVLFTLMVVVVNDAP